MTDIRDINSTDYTTTDIHGNTVYKVRDSLFAETLLSVIIGITVLTFMTLVKSYMELFTVSMYAQFSVLIVAVAHTILRRLSIKSKPAVFALHILVSALFYFVLTTIPVLEFGSTKANRIYLIIILIALTVFSLLYRFKPRLSAADTEFIVFPAAIHAIAYILYAITGQHEKATQLLIHAIMIAVIFIIMRQIAVFDTKYYHSLHKLSKPSALLKNQNRKTAIGLIGIVVISLGVVLIFPYDPVTDFLKRFIVICAGVFWSFISGHEQDITIAPMDPEESIAEEEEVFSPDMPWLDILGKALVIAIAVAIIIIIINIIRLIIQHAPKMLKPEEIKDGILSDTIENIEPEVKNKAAGRHDFGSGHERRIRKQFYEKTRHAMRKGLPVYKSSTPGQIEKVLKENGDKEISALKAEYEKVRYGK